MRRIIFALALLIIGSAIGAPASAAHNQFGDWFATCDNQRNCTAIGARDFPGDGSSQGYVRIVHPAAGPLRISLTVDEMADDAPPGPWSVGIDHGAVPGLASLVSHRTTTDTGSEDHHDRQAVLTPTQSAALLPAMRNGHELVVTGSGGALATVQLTGLTAALLWIDEQQHRRGSAAPTITPARLPTQTGLPRRATPQVLAALHTTQQLCEETASHTPYAVARLGPNLLLWNMPCSSGAYNELSQFVFSDARGLHARLVLLPQPSDESPSPLEQPFNSSFDVHTGVLINDEKLRSMGDCGAFTEWVWDGRAFRLLRSRAMNVCRGVRPADWGTTYEAHLVGPSR